MLEVEPQAVAVPSDVAALVESVGVTPPLPARALWDAFKENRGAVMGLAVVVVVVLLAIFADVVAPYPPNEQFRDAVRAAPAWADGGSMRFILGTDSLGRDMLSRLIHGARISLFIGLSVMGVSFVIGGLLGLACVSWT
jgi:dipeptide transport system permease protein